MKKIFIGVFSLLTLFTIKTQGTEIIPEYFLMERLIMLMEVSPTYISNDNEKELKAMQIDDNVMTLIGNTETPFYIDDSNGQKKLVRVGDYFYSPPILSSIYALDKKNFDANFKNKNLPQEKPKNTQDILQNNLNTPNMNENISNNLLNVNNLN